MTFRQKWHIDEDTFGRQYFLLVFADTFDGLYSTDYVETDIFTVGSIKQDLNLDENSFAIDTFDFSLSFAACSTDNDLNAAYFVTGASDLNKSVYCALFFADAPNVADQAFIGRVFDDVKRKDLFWQCGTFPVRIDPVSEYSFTAKSFDMSILDTVKYNGSMTRVDGPDIVPVDNVMERWRKGASLAALSVWPFVGYCFLRSGFLTPKMPLYEAIRQCLSYAADVIFETDGTNIAFEFVPSVLPFKSNMAIPRAFQKNYNGGFTAIPTFWDVFPKSDLFSVGILPAETNNVHPLLIDSKMVCPTAFYPDVDSTDATELSFSFARFGSVAELLYAVARAFAGYVIARPVSGNRFSIEIASIDSLVDSEETRFIDATESDSETVSVDSSAVDVYYARSTPYTSDDSGLPHNRADLRSWIRSSPSGWGARAPYGINIQSELAATDRQTLTSRNKTKFSELLFTTVTDFVYFHYDCGEIPQTALGIRFVADTAASEKSDRAFNNPPSSPDNNLITSALYIKAVHPSADHNLVSGAYTAPIRRVYVNIDGVDCDFDTLTEYVNRQSKRDKHFYKNTRTLTVPSINGFIRGNAVPSWKNVRLGSSVRLSETVRSFVDGKFVEFVQTRNYIVTSLERDVASITTKIKLENKSRAALAEYVGSPDGAGGGGMFDDAPTDTDTSAVYRSVPVEPPVYALDAMFEGAAGVIRRGNSQFDGSTPIGVAVSELTPNSAVTIQVSGVVNYPAGMFVNDNSPFIYCRTNESGSNLTDVCFDSPTTEEDYLVVVGRKVPGANQFVIDIFDEVFE